MMMKSSKSLENAVIIKHKSSLKRSNYGVAKAEKEKSSYRRLYKERLEFISMHMKCESSLSQKRSTSYIMLYQNSNNTVGHYDEDYQRKNANSNKGRISLKKAIPYEDKNKKIDIQRRTLTRNYEQKIVYNNMTNTKKNKLREDVRNNGNGFKRQMEERKKLHKQMKEIQMALSKSSPQLLLNKDFCDDYHLIPIDNNDYIKKRKQSIKCSNDDLYTPSITFIRTKSHVKVLNDNKEMTNHYLLTNMIKEVNEENDYSIINLQKNKSSPINNLIIEKERFAINQCNNESLISVINHTKPSPLLTEDNETLIDFIQKTESIGIRNLNNPNDKKGFIGIKTRNDYHAINSGVLSPRMSYVIPLSHRLNNIKENPIIRQYNPSNEDFYTLKSPKITASINRLSAIEISRNNINYKLRSKPLIITTTTPTSRGGFLTKLKKEREQSIETSIKENINTINRCNTYKQANPLSFLHNLTSLTKSISKPYTNIIMPVNNLNTVLSYPKDFHKIQCK